MRAVTHEGHGIADGPGKTAFVAGALEGELVRFVRRRKRRNYDEAELLEVIEPSESRIEPRCDAFGRCGGCALQHVGQDEQRRLKQTSLADSLERIGKVRPEAWRAPLTAGDGWQYRRRARLAVKDVPGKGRVLVGFRERHAPYVTDMHRCEVLCAPLDGLIDALSELVGRLSIRSRLPQIEIAAGDDATELVFRVLAPPAADDLEQLKAFGRAQGLRVALQPAGLDSVQRIEPEGELTPLHYRLPEFDVDIAFEPTDFVQVNADINRRMVAATVDSLALSPSDRVIDLYCGIGNFSLPVARHAAEVVGVEGEKRLVQRAADNARRNGIGNAQFECADLAKLDGRERWIDGGCDRLLLDPARSGALEVVRRIDRFAPERIVYVSCHPGTLARDAGILVNEAGYRLVEAGIIDMFPHTAHVESIAVFDS